MCESGTWFMGPAGRTSGSKVAKARAPLRRPLPIRSAPLSAVTWLAFDIIGTVFDVHTSLSNGIRAVGKRIGLTLDPDSSSSAWMSGYVDAVERVNDGRPWTPPDRILKDAFAQMLANKGLAPMSTKTSNAFFQLWRQLDPWPDIANGMHRLHERFRLSVLSNMSMATQTKLKQHAGLPFDRLLSAAAVKKYKPDPAVYRMATTDLCAKPDQIMMVAAHKYDLRAARVAGFRTAFIKRPLESGPKGTVDTASDPTFDINADGFEDLATQLGL